MCYFERKIVFLGIEPTELFVGRDDLDGIGILARLTPSVLHVCESDDRGVFRLDTYCSCKSNVRGVVSLVPDTHASDLFLRRSDDELRLVEHLHEPIEDAPPLGPLRSLYVRSHFFEDVSAHAAFVVSTEGDAFDQVDVLLLLPGESENLDVRIGNYHSSTRRARRLASRSNSRALRSSRR